MSVRYTNTPVSDGSGTLSVDDGASSLTVDGAVTVTNATAANLKAEVVGTGTFATQAAAAGDIAHDGIDSGNPVKVGAVAIAHGTNPTAVAAADRTNLYANRAGIPFVIGGHPNIITRRDTFSTAQTDVALVTISTGAKIVVTRVSATCDNANTVDVAVRIGFGTANTPTGAGVVLSHPGIAKGSGVVEGNGAGILGVGADNEDLRITCEAATSGAVDIVTSYYTIES